MIDSHFPCTLHNSSVVRIQQCTGHVQKYIAFVCFLVIVLVLPVEAHGCPLEIKNGPAKAGPAGPVPPPICSMCPHRILSTCLNPTCFNLVQCWSSVCPIELSSTQCDIGPVCVPIELSSTQCHVVQYVSP